MRHTITFEADPRDADIQVLSSGILDYAKQQKDHKPIDYFAFFVRDKQKKIVGGCTGGNMYGCLYIDQLWLNESLRHQGYGTELIKQAEQFGLQHHCSVAAVNTMEWEALEFYKKLGYTVEFERHGFLHNSVFYYLRKNLNALTEPRP